MSDLREYLRANLFDGNEDGTVTMKVSYLLDEVVELVKDRTDRLRQEVADWEALANNVEAENKGLREELEDRTNQVRALEEFGRLSIETGDRLRELLDEAKEWIEETDPIGEPLLRRVLEALGRDQR